MRGPRTRPHECTHALTHVNTHLVVRVSCTRVPMHWTYSRLIQTIARSIVQQFVQSHWPQEKARTSTGRFLLCQRGGTRANLFKLSTRSGFALFFAFPYPHDLPSSTTFVPSRLPPFRWSIGFLSTSNVTLTSCVNLLLPARKTRFPVIVSHRPSPLSPTPSNPRDLKASKLHSNARLLVTPSGRYRVNQRAEIMSKNQRGA